jgi:hypothetical protein
MEVGGVEGNELEQRMSISGFADSALPSQLQAFSELAIFTHNRQQCSSYCHPFTS